MILRPPAKSVIEMRQLGLGGAVFDRIVSYSSYLHEIGYVTATVEPILGGWVFGLKTMALRPAW